MIDINPNYLQDETQTNDLLTGGDAIVRGAMFNLLNTTPGENSAMFAADVGSFWRNFLQEPICDTTAAKIELEIFSSIEKWLPNVSLTRAGSQVVADFKLPGYQVHIQYTSPDVTGTQKINFAIPI